MLSIGQLGTTRDGQHGRIIEAFTNGARFQSDTGAQFTILTAEFIPDAATPGERKTLLDLQVRLFGHIGRRAWSYRHKREQGQISEVQIRALDREGAHKC